MEKIKISTPNGISFDVFSPLEAYLVETDSEFYLDGYDLFFDCDIEQMISSREQELHLDEELIVEINHLKLLQKSGVTVIVATKKPNDNLYTFHDINDPSRPTADDLLQLYLDAKQD